VLAVHKDLNQPKKVIKKNHSCHICLKAFVSAFKVRRHLVVHDTELKTGLQKNWTRNYFLCQHCLRKFHTKATYERHTIICDMLMKSEIQRTPNYDYLCAICLETFKLHDDMVDHIKNLHHQFAEQEIKCQLCNNFTGNINDIVRHGRYHEENATYKCSVCEKLFPNGDEIISHLLRHANYRPFPCTHPGCEKKFFDRYKLKSHQASHDPNTKKKYVCDACNRAFTHLDYLNCHIRRKHSSIRPYNCTYCSKSFAFHHDLNLHLTVHTNNKKHICMICEASFTKSWSLKQHMLLHEVNPLQLQCPFCTCSFSALSKAQFTKHLAIHNEKISFICEECNIEYKTEEELKSHLEEAHQNRYAFIDDTDANSNDPYSTLVEIPNSY
jgi:KRAB domain-containing zinc finger protein